MESNHILDDNPSVAENIFSNVSIVAFCLLTPRTLLSADSCLSGLEDRAASLSMADTEGLCV